VTVTPLGGPSDLLLHGVGAATRSYAGPSSAVVVAAAGSLAAGVEAVQRSRTDSGPARGLAAVRCVTPGGRFTFLGVGTGLGEDPRLVLTNAGDIPALVDVGLAADSGQLPSTTAQGLRVAPRTRVEVRLVGIAPNRGALAVTVNARTGRVAAALWDSRRDGDTPKGDDWVPPTAPAARQLVIAGVPAHAGGQRLVLADPGPIDATAQIEVVRSDGSSVPTGLEGVPVKAGAVGVVDVGQAIGGQAVALRITADQPLQAGLVTSLPGANGFTDTAFTAATRPVTDAVAALPASVGGATQQAALHLVAAGGAAEVRLVPVGGAPGAAAVQVDLRPGTVRVVDPSTLWQRTEPAAVDVEVVPGSGPVRVATTWYEQGARGPLVTVVPAVPEPRTVTRPGSRPDPLAGLAQRPGQSS
jgi:hypothetical protein